MKKQECKREKTQIKPTEIIYPQVYGYTLPPEEARDKKDFIKVGYTERKDVNERIYEQTHTAAMRLDPHFEFKRQAIFATVNKQYDGKRFTDKQLHSFFIRNGARRLSNKAGEQEWFNMPNHHIPDWAIKLTDQYRKQDFKIVNDKVQRYTLREEQQQAVKETLNYYHTSKDPRFLWNAKPRFGKTLTAYDFAIHGNFKKILVATNRPAIANSWYQDYQKFVGPEKYLFISTADSLKDKDNHKWVFAYEELTDEQKKDNCICFFSLQDLKGAKWAGGRKEKLNWVRNTNWDLLIIDEAHEGAETVRADKLFNKIKRKFSLYLSGTPFTALKSGEFKPEQIFTWSYEDEQKKKIEYAREHPDASNPYQNPMMSLFTYRLSDMVKEKALGQIDEGNYSYDLKSFFQTKRNENGVPKFVHEDLVRQFLKTLSTGKKFPFSTKKLREGMPHTLWLLDRVDSARALQDLLEEGSTKFDPFTMQQADDYNPFKASFNVIRAYGSSSTDSNNSDDEDQQNERKESSNNKKNESSYKRVIKGIKQAEKEGKGTITLSCGQLTTGVTIKPWSGVLMLSNTVSPALYIQAAFRAQNLYEFQKDGKHYRKERAYVFDFSPERALEVYDTFATGLESRPITKHQEYDERINRMVDLFPVISENQEGVMQETDTSYIVSLPQKYKSDKVFEKGFDSDYLINDLAIKTLDSSVIETLKQMNLDSTATNGSDDVFSINDNSLPVNKNDHQNDTGNNQEKINDRDSYIVTDDTRNQELKDKAKQIARIMPSLIFAYADEKITLDNFATYVPEGIIEEIFHIDRDTFSTILRSDLFNAPVFHQAALDLVNLSNKVRNDFSEKRQKELFSKLPSISNNLVYTPFKVVNKLLDTLEDNDPQVFDDPQKTFCDPFVKSGSFLYGIVNKLYNSPKIRKVYPDNDKRLQHILTKQIYGFTVTKLFKVMVSSLLPAGKVHIQYKNYNYRNHKLEGDFNNMKFDVIIGNPPYQASDGGAQASATPIYNKFVDLARNINTTVIALIIPARWYTGGKGLNKFRDSMLNDTHIKKLYDFTNPEEVFPHTNIRGGVCIFIWDKNYDNTAAGVEIITMKHNKEVLQSQRALNSLGLGIFIRDSHALSILKKIKNRKFINLVSARKPFGLGGTFIKKQLFYKSCHNLTSPVKIYGKKTIGYTASSTISKHKDWINRVKVLVPRSNNIGTELNDDNLNAFVVDQGTACTETYLVIGGDLNLSKESAGNIVKYLKTKFVRYLISIAKASQDASRSTYKFVPVQNFMSNNDIDWSVNVSGIDKQLYKKYKLSKNEIDFIETKVKAMK